MDYKSFYEELKRGEINRVYLFEGEEEYGKESALKALCAALLKGPMALMNESVLINPGESELIAACETLPILQERRLVLVKECSCLLGRGSQGDGEEPKTAPGRAGADGLAGYMDRLPEHVCLVFHIRGKAAGAKRLYKKIREMGGIVAFEQLDQEMLIKWIARELQDYGKRIARQTAEQLVFGCGREMMPLKGEIAKLAAHAGDRGTITQEDIQAVATLSAEYRVFDLAEKVADGQAKQVMLMLKNMLEGGEQRLMLLSLLQRHYRQMLIARILLDEGQSHLTAGAQLGIPGFAARRMYSSAGAYDVQALRRAYRICIQQEYLIKSGRISEEGSLEGLILALIQLRNKGEPAEDD